MELKNECERCGLTKDLLFQNVCMHTTMCEDCGRWMGRNRVKCPVCESDITQLKLVLDVRPPKEEEDEPKEMFITSFRNGAPEAGVKLHVKKDETCKGKGICKGGGMGACEGEGAGPCEGGGKGKGVCTLENEAGDVRYEGRRVQPDAAYFTLVPNPKKGECVAVPVTYWYEMTKAPVIPVESQFTLAQAEEQMAKRRKIEEKAKKRMLKHTGQSSRSNEAGPDSDDEKSTDESMDMEDDKSSDEDGGDDEEGCQKATMPSP